MRLSPAGSMKLLITGICGFAGSTIAENLLQRREGLSIIGLDNLLRPGSERNRIRLAALGIPFVHGDIRTPSDLAGLPAVDWIIDAAAHTSVLAGVEQGVSSRQLLEHNLWGTINVLECARQHQAGVILLSSSRVYSTAALRSLPLRNLDRAFHLNPEAPLPDGVSPKGIGRSFSTQPPISLYGSTKLASEIIALEYGEAFGLPVWINRCGVLAGAAQFGTPDQGIIAFWIHAHRAHRPLRYYGFGGTGEQVRDVLHPRDLAALLDYQMHKAGPARQRLYTAGGGIGNAVSLANLTAWCDDRFGIHPVQADGRDRRYDVPWIVMDSGDAERDFDWSVETPLAAILDEIAEHANQHPEWLEISGV
jgi:CDP-paratose 2-epimerase